MNSIKIKPQMLKGIVDIPPSKSIVLRLILAAFLSAGDCVIQNVKMSDDVEAMLGAIKILGAKYSYNSKTDTLKIGRLKKATFANEITIDCFESASVLRFLIPVSLISKRDVVFLGRGRLMDRPIMPYLNMFKKHGVLCKKQGKKVTVSGQLECGIYEICGNISSQFISGLLFALPVLEGDSEIIVTTETESKSYIEMTLSVLKKFGIKIDKKDDRHFFIKGGQKYIPTNETAEADYTQAANFLVAGALGSDIVCRGLREKSVQGDFEILNIIKSAGGLIEKREGGISARRTAFMHSVTVDASNIPDLVPIVAVLLAFCDGESEIINAGRLRMKESDRLTVICRELRHLGADIREVGDGLKIIGKQVVCESAASASGDHRIAMALSVAALRCENTCVEISGGEEAVKKSYPEFYEVFKSLYSE